MAAEIGLVDTLMNLPDPPGQDRAEDPNIARWFHQSKVVLLWQGEADTVEQLIVR